MHEGEEESGREESVIQPDLFCSTRGIQERYNV